MSASSASGPPRSSPTPTPSPAPTPSPGPSPSPSPTAPGVANASTRFWVFPVMLAQYFALGLLRPEMPGMLLELFSGNMQHVALYQGATDGVGALVAFALVPWIGSYSDTHGRRPALLISALSAAAPVFVLASYPYIIGGQMTLILYALVALVSKLNSYSVALSYVADCSSLSKRSAAFGEVSGVMFLGLTGGPFVSGFLDRSSSLGTAAMLNIASALFIVFIMPETKPPAETLGEPLVRGGGAQAIAGNDSEKKGLLSAGDSKRYNTADVKISNMSDKKEEAPKKSKQSMMLAYHFLMQNPLYMLIGLITLISQFAVFGVGQVYYLYLTEELAFQRADTIRAALIGGVETSIVMLVVMPWLSKRCHESVLMMLGLCAYIIYALGLSLAASSPQQAFGIILFWSISGLTFPATCALLSSHTSSSATGLAQGALSAVRCCASGLGPALFALLFSHMVTLKHAELGPGRVNYAEDTATWGFGSFFSVHYTAIPFVIGGIMMAISLVLTAYLPSSRAHAPLPPAPAAADKKHAKKSGSKNNQSKDHSWPDPELGHGKDVGASASASSASASSSSSAHPASFAAVASSAATAKKHASKWAKVRSIHRRRKLVDEGVGHFTFWDEWQHLRAHLMNRKHEHEHDEDDDGCSTEEYERLWMNHHETPTQERVRALSLSSHDLLASGDANDEEDASNSLAVPTGDESAEKEFVFELPQARSATSRWTWLTTLSVVVVATLIGVSFVGHYFAAPPADATSVSSSTPAIGAPHTATTTKASEHFAASQTFDVEDVEDLVSTDQSAVQVIPASSALVVPGAAAATASSKPSLKDAFRPITVMSLMGPPGVGKTALSRHLTKAYGLTPLSSGVLIRSEISRGTALGTSIRSTVENGGLIADETVLHLVEQEIRRLQANDSSWPGVILDGFPRTLPQARMLDAPDSPLPPLSPMVYVHMRDDILAERRAGRRICPVCGASYNLNPIDRDGYYLAARHPKHADQTKCDRENATLVPREDDREDIAQRRMKAFREESLPMVAYYKERGVLIDIEKTRSAGQIFKQIRAQMEQFMDEEREKEIKKMEKQQKKDSKKSDKDGEKDSKKEKKSNNTTDESAEPDEAEEEAGTPQHPKHSVNTPHKRQGGGGN